MGASRFPRSRRHVLSMPRIGLVVGNVDFRSSKHPDLIHGSEVSGTDDQGKHGPGVVPLGERMFAVAGQTAFEHAAS